jgi:hypothetical protein
LLLAFAAAAAAGLAAYYSMRPREVASNLAAPVSAVGPPTQHIAMLRQAPVVPASEHARIGESIASQIEPPATEAQRLNPRLREQLARTLLEHVAALTSDLPDHYLRLLDGAGSRWIPHDAPEWHPVDYAMEHLQRRVADRADPRRELMLLFQEYRCMEDERFSHVATGDRGMRIVVEFTRTPRDIEYSLIAERSGVAEHDYWNKGGRHGIRLHRPPVTHEEVFRKHGALLFAQSAIQFRISRDRPVIWHATWFFNPDSDSWVNHSMAVESYSGAALFY